MTGGQTDLFGNPVVPIPQQRQRRAESNDVDLMHMVAANAVRCGYLLVGTSERVYARVTDRDGRSNGCRATRRRPFTNCSGGAG